jgi:hypothetical protein
MKPLPLILSFLPLIAFSLLARLLPHGDVGWAGLIAALCAVVAIAVSRPVWPPKIISACSLVLFTVIAVLGFTLGKNDDRWVATWGGAGVGLVIGLVILALIPLIPFTEQFARESTPKAYWDSPAFKKINLVLSAAWGAAIFFLGVFRVAAAAVGGRLPEVLLGTVIPVVIIVYGLKFSREYPERVTRGEGAAAQPATRPAGR